MIRLCCIIPVIFVPLIAFAEDLSDYRYFKDQGILDASISNEKANYVVAAGIVSENPAIVDMTIRALGVYASIAVNSLPNRYGPLPHRSFQAVPDLKEFLIGYWRERYHGSGGDPTSTVLRELGSLDGRSLEGWTVEGLLPDVEGNMDRAYTGDLLVAVSERISPWTMIPGILCTYWPTDEEVHQLLWERHRSDPDPNIALTTLALLNDGMFTTSQATAYRIEMLSSSRDQTAGAAVALASRGLELSHPNEALPHLIDAAYREAEAREDVLMAIAGYDREQIFEYAVELRPLLETVKSKSPLGTELEVLGRLERLLGEQSR